jgi:type IV pili sensor histidine kinase/response regulator
MRVPAQLLISLLLGFSVLAWAKTESVQTGRYTNTDLGPTLEQRDPLAATLTVILPQELTTVGDGLNYVLQHSGYRIQSLELAPNAAPLYGLPLPDVHRHLGPMSLRDALTVLAGPAYTLQLDRAERTVTFSPTALGQGSKHHGH